MTNIGSRQVQIIVPRTWDAWTEGFRDLPEEAPALLEAHWMIATELFFDRTQDAVHIQSGDLKDSGRSEVRVLKWSVIGDVIYGGTMGTEGPVDYAQEENDRGGDHAYLNNAWPMAEYAFNRAMPAVWKEVVSGWR